MNAEVVVSLAIAAAGLFLAALVVLRFWDACGVFGRRSQRPLSWSARPLSWFYERDRGARR